MNLRAWISLVVRKKVAWLIGHFLTVIGLSVLAGCETEGVRLGSPVNELVAHPYTDGSRINSPPKGNCLNYAVTLQSKLKTLYNMDSRLLLFELVTDEGVKLPAKHVIVVYTENGKVCLADNNHNYPVRAQAGGTDQAWAEQMMPLFWKTTILDDNYHWRPESPEKRIILERLLDASYWKNRPRSVWTTTSTDWNGL